jgi:hypothetical protein
MSNSLATLDYIEPKKGVWRSVRRSVLHGIAPIAQTSRARRPESKAEVEFRQASLFALARASLASDATMRFAMVPEEADSADAVLRIGSAPDAHQFELVQLKEVVPDTVDERQTLDGLLESIRRRYCTGELLTIAIHMNRDLVTTLGTIPDPLLRKVTFWLFGLCDSNRVFIVNDPFGRFAVFEFDIPRAPSSITQW